MSKTFFVRFLSCAVFSLLWDTAFAARWISVEISLNGEVILTGSDSDNGESDADTIWNSLKHLKLRETEAFQKHDIDPKLKEFKFDLDPPEHGKPWPIKIDASFGGVKETRFVTIKRVEPDEFGSQWCIDPADVESMFDYRMIGRSEAGNLKDPSYSAIAARFSNKTTVLTVREWALSSMFSLAMAVGWAGGGMICLVLCRRRNRPPCVAGASNLDSTWIVSWGIFSFVVALACLLLYLTEV